MALLLVLCLEVHFYELFIILKVKKEKKNIWGMFHALNNNIFV